VVVSEARLNDLGYSLLQQKKVAEAITVFKVNVDLYPQSANVYDSLASLHDEWREAARDCQLQEVGGAQSAKHERRGDVEEAREMSRGFFHSAMR